MRETFVECLPQTDPSHTRRERVLPVQDLGPPHQLDQSVEEGDCCLSLSLAGTLQDGSRIVDLARRRARVPYEFKRLGDRELSPALPETLVASMKIGTDGGAEDLMEGSHLVRLRHRILPQLELSQRPPAPVLCAILQPGDHRHSPFHLFLACHTCLDTLGWVRCDVTGIMDR